MLSISGGKVCGCRASAAENDEPDLDIGLHLHERGLQLLVVGLLDEDRQRAHQRQARVDQPGHLPREDRERPRRDMLRRARQLDLAVESGLGLERDLERA